MGVPTIVTDVDTFNDEPDDAVLRVQWENDGLQGLVAALRRLLGDTPLRHQIGEGGRALVQSEHRWPVVAAQYAELIEALSVTKRSAG